MCARANAVQHVFTAVLRVAEKRFLADAAIMDHTVLLDRNNDKGEKKGKPWAGKVDGRGG